MNRRFRVKIEPLAQTSLEEALAYIQEHSGPDRATSWLRSLFESIDGLETLPKAFGIWTHRDGEPIFSKLAPPYRIFFVVNEITATVHVIDLVHSARETRLADYRDQPE